MAIFTGTFDRIQRQIFNQSCAGERLPRLAEPDRRAPARDGRVLRNLIDVTPQMPGRGSAGWKRVDAANASAENSFIFHKLTGDLDGTQGAACRSSAARSTTT
jgi:hypothetical protein